jgi:ABC-2 type transport system permease protein
MERRLEPQERRRQDYARTADRIARVIAWLSPQAAFHTALTDLAGTGTSRHRDFLQAVRAFQLELRAFMYPRVLEPVTSPISSACIGCPGRLTFAEYDVIPRFAFTDAAPNVRSAAAVRTAAWFALLATGCRRGGHSGKAGRGRSHLESSPFRPDHRRLR